MRYNAEGIILRKQNFRDSDSFFSVYTAEKGKVEAIARGVKKSKSKLGGHLDYFLVADLMIAEGKKFNHIGGALISRNFSNIKNDLRKINLGFYCLEIADHLIKTEKEDKRIFLLLRNLMEALEKKDDKADYFQSLGISYAFILKLLIYLGYRPDFSNCLECKDNLRRGGNKFFDPASGSVICGRCSGDRNGKITISDKIIEKIDLLIEADLKKFEIKKEELGDLIKIIDPFLLYRLDGEIKSRRFLVKS